MSDKSQATAVAMNHSRTNIISQSYHKPACVCVQYESRQHWDGKKLNSFHNVHFMTLKKISMVATKKGQITSCNINRR